MSEVAHLSKPKILRQVGEASVQKAKGYLRRDVWSDLRLQGPTIKGRCQGQAPSPYRVTVTFDGDDIAEADCSCPVGLGGHCKHVAAMLLYYREHPDTFVEVEELEAALERRSKGELVALIRRMIRRVPELELLLDAPLPGYTNGEITDDPEPFRRQARATFQHGGDEWGAAPAIAHELADIVATGDEFRTRGEYAAAVAVYRGVAEEVLEQFESYHDDEGDLLGVVTDCAEGLCHCLEGVPADAERRDDLIHALVDLYLADEALGGLGVSDTIPEALLHQTTPEERRRVAGWLRAKLPKGTSWSDEYLRRSLGSFLLELEADELDDEAYLKLCRETGRATELVDRLLTLKQLDEALKVVRAAEDHEVLPLADLLVRHGHRQEAEWLIEDRSTKTKETRQHDTHLLEWLKRQALERRDKAAALKLAEQIFQRQPSMENYDEVRRLAGTKAWPELRQRFQADLERSRSAWLLIDIYLQEHEIERALALVRTDWGKHSGRKLDVAKAAEKDHPREALTLYREAAEHLIEQRGRDSYRSASEYLRKVRDLHRKLDESEAWTAYIADLRERHRSLRALREELDRAKL